MSAHRDRGPQSQRCCDIHALAVTATVTCQCGTISSTSSGDGLCQQQPPQDPVPVDFPGDTRHIPAPWGKALSCLPEAGVSVPRGAGCGAASPEFPRGASGVPGCGPVASSRLHSTHSAGPSGSARLSSPKKGAASVCKMDLPALTSVVELSGLSQPTKPVINPPNDRFSFCPHQSNLGNVYSSIVPHAEARGENELVFFMSSPLIPGSSGSTNKSSPLKSSPGSSQARQPHAERW